MTHTHVTGGFGAGKTTSIRRLMSHKPESEWWVVILNEFTAAGFDTLSVAECAYGQYDVRLVAGGCPCCALPLDSMVCLINPLDCARILHTRDANECCQIQSADVVNHLGLWAVSRLLPWELTFSRVVIEPRLTRMIEGP